MSNHLIFLKYKDYLIWPILTYIFKLFINIYYLLYLYPLLYNIIPVFILIVNDIIQIYISITYNIKNHVPYYDTIDYVSINIKILVNTYMYYIVYISRLDNILLHIIQYINILYTIYITYSTLQKISSTHYVCLKNKCISFSIIFLLGTIPMILCNSLYKNDMNINYCIISYIIGGIFWICKIPEKYIKIRYFVSAGWMHVFVIIGDIYLINGLINN